MKYLELLGATVIPFIIGIIIGRLLFKIWKGY